MDEILKVIDLTFRYDDLPVLENLNLIVNRGERLALLGKNGSGKSTLFLILTGVLKPESGKVYLNDSLIKYNKKGIRELRKKIGFIFQNANNQIIAPTVFDEVSFGPLNMNLPEEEVIKRTQEVLEKLNLTQLAERPPHYLSGGELKRVTIADIISMNPEIYLFDEPLASLDPIESENLSKILDELHRQGKTLIISTHSVDFAWEWADRIAVMAEHSIVATGTPEQIFSDYSLLRKANLKEPKLFEISQFLKEKSNKTIISYPRTVEELKEQLGQIQEM